MFFRQFRMRANSRDGYFLASMFLAVSIGFAILLSLPRQGHLESADVLSKTLSYDKATLQVHYASARSGMRKSHSIDLYSASTKYVLWDDVWEDLYSTDHVLTALQATNMASIHYFAGDSLHVLGLQAHGISLPPSIGVHLHNQSRIIITAIIILCAVLSCCFFLAPSVLKKYDHISPGSPA